MMTIPPDPQLGPATACIDDFYARTFRNWPEAVNRHTDGYVLSYSGDRRLTGANHLWPYTLDALSPATLAEAKLFFEDLEAAWSVVITDTCLPGAAARLTEMGYYPRWQSPLMVLDTLPERLPVRATRVQVIRASTTQHLDHVRHVMTDAFSTGSSVNRRVVRPAHLSEPGIVHYLAYAGAEPTACASVALCSDMASVWNVGTRFAFRRQGYAAAIMLALLDDLRADGYAASTLMASPEGYHLYERLGYRPIGMTMYMGPVLMRRGPLD
jgi:predicted GNAT family acetyltransferase